MGGEWTVKKYLANLVDFITDETDIKFTLLSNSSFDKKTQKQLVEAGLEGYFASVDYYSDKLKTEDLTGKSSPGLKMLFELKDSGVETLGANTVIMPQNMETIPDLLEYLTENEIVMNICSVHGEEIILLNIERKTVLEI
ncbi:MAG: hypothetical protein KAT28_03625 [Candidatus Aenigmarchaeota archaeon]|nr:hypothetical protein [Candidatus Aenigmarchaeota archaeon]